MIKAKDELNEWKEHARTLKIEGAVDFAGWMAVRYNLPEKDLSTSLIQWKEQLK